MAKAQAECTCKHCGKKFWKSAVKQNRRQADQWEEWAATYYDECDECYKSRLARERDEQNAAALEQSAERNYPELKGTEKQVAWANTIRISYMDHLNEIAEKVPEMKPFMDAMIEFTLSDARQADLWIDKRDAFNEMDITMVRRFKDAHHLNTEGLTTVKKVADAYIASLNNIESPAEKSTETPAEEPAEAPAEEPAVKDTDIVTTPADQTHPGVVEIIVTDRQVSASYLKEDEFRALVKRLGYQWISSAWRKDITVTTGTAVERAAELGNKLLNAGYAIHISDPAIRQAAIDGGYEPETHRWISCRANGQYAGWLSISWGKLDDLYAAAKALPRARYDKPNVVVPATQYMSVEDFAHTYGFKFTPGAREAIEKERASAECVTPAPVKVSEYDEHPIEDVLNSSREVLDDLRDD